MRLAVGLALLATAVCHAALLPRPFAELGAWIVSSGGFVSDALAIEETGAGGGRGLCVSRAVEAGEPLMAVPRCCTLHASAESGLKAHEALMLRLLEEEARGAGSEFGVYLSTLPSHIRLLRDWPEPELQRMPADLVARVEAHRRSVDTTVDRVRRAAALRALQAGDESIERLVKQGGVCGGAPASAISSGGLRGLSRPPIADATRGDAAAAMAVSCAEPISAPPITADPLLAPPALADRSHLLWAESVVRSRSLAFTADDGSAALALVPIFDLANHQRVGEEAALREEREAREGGVKAEEGAGITPVGGVNTPERAVNAAHPVREGPALEMPSAPLSSESSTAPPVLITSDGCTVLCARTPLRPGEAVMIEYAGVDEGGAAGLLLDYGFADPPGADLGLWGNVEEAAERARRAAAGVARAREGAGRGGEAIQGEVGKNSEGPEGAEKGAGRSAEARRSVEGVEGAAARDALRSAVALSLSAQTSLLRQLRRSILDDAISVCACLPSMRVSVTNVTCLRPAEVGAGIRLYDDDLRSLWLEEGRRCEGGGSAGGERGSGGSGGCGACCSRVALVGLASASECARLLSLARPLLPPPDTHGFNLYLKASAASGALPLHLGMMRLVERCRRAVAGEYGIPLRTLTPRQAFLSRMTEQTDPGEYTQVREGGKGAKDQLNHAVGANVAALPSLPLLCLAARPSHTPSLSPCPSPPPAPPHSLPPSSSLVSPLPDP